MRLALLTEKAACGVPEMPSNEIQQALVISDGIVRRVRLRLRPGRHRHPPHPVPELPGKAATGAP